MFVRVGISQAVSHDAHNIKSGASKSEKVLKYANYLMTDPFLVIFFSFSTCHIGNAIKRTLNNNLHRSDMPLRFAYFQG